MTTVDERRSVLSRIAHDVGKHVARAAINVRDGETPPVLIDMMAKDLYALRDGARASAVLRAMLGEAGERVRSDARLGRCVALLAEADRLETSLRAHRPEAVQRCATIAREVRELLLEAARDAGGPT